MIYTVTFNPAIDYVVRLGGALQLGAVNRSAAEEYQCGGKGINVSTVLTRLGVPSVALGFVAGFTGAGLVQGLAAQGVRTDFVHLDTGMTRVNVKIKSAEETEINGIGPNIDAAAIQQLYQKLDAIPAGSMLVLAGSIPACLPGSTYAQIMQRLAGRDIQITVDATQDLLLNVLQYRPFLIKPNNHELAELAGRALPDDAAIAAAAAELQQKGARNVLVSLAGAGALLLDENGRTHRIGAPKGRVLNSVGAGDSMVAGFLAGCLQRPGDYAYALRLGTAAGSATAFSLGLAEKDAILQLLQAL